VVGPAAFLGSDELETGSVSGPGAFLGIDAFLGFNAGTMPAVEPGAFLESGEEGMGSVVGPTAFLGSDEPESGPLGGLEHS
jgi:hypothetical protein